MVFFFVFSSLIRIIRLNNQHYQSGQNIFILIEEVTNLKY